MSVHPIIQKLQTSYSEDLLPAADTSSHWQQYGNLTKASISEDGPELEGVGFGDFKRTRFEWLRSLIGRWYFRSVTSKIDSYSTVQAEARELASDLGIGFTYEAWRQAVSVAVLKDHWEERNLEPKTFALIGDGYGFCGALIRRIIPNTKLLQVDLPKILIFQVDTISRADPDAKLALLAESQDADVVFACPSAIESYSSGIDCAINMASMGEMTHRSILQYFDFLRKRSRDGSHFYCVNRDSKTHPDGTVIRFDDYPWKETDETFLDGVCPYYTHYWSSRGSSTGPRIAGLRIPYLVEFEGPLRHRLVRLASE